MRPMLQTAAPCTAECRPHLPGLLTPTARSGAGEPSWKCHVEQLCLDSWCSRARVASPWVCKSAAEIHVYASQGTQQRGPWPRFYLLAAIHAEGFIIFIS